MNFVDLMKSFPALCLLLFPLVLFSQSNVSNRSDFDLYYFEKSSDRQIELFRFNQFFTYHTRIDSLHFSYSNEQSVIFNRFETDRNNLRFTLGQHQNEHQFSLLKQWNNWTVQTKLLATYYNDILKPGLFLSVRYHFSDFNSVFISASQKSAVYYHSWEALDSRADFYQWSDVFTYQAGGSFKFFRDFDLQFKASTQNYSPELTGDLFAERSSFRNYSGDLNFKWHYSDRWIHSFQFEGFYGFGNPEWFYLETPFSSNENGLVTDYRLSASSLFQSSSDIRYTGSLSLINQSLQSDGLLQSFPFTPAIISLISDYYFYSMDVNLSRFSMNLKRESVLSGRSSYSISAGYEFFQPNVNIQSWEPLFLLFGRKNEQISRLDIVSAHFLPISGSWNYQCDALKFSFGLSQLIPIYFETKVASKSTGNSEPNPNSGSESNSENRIVWGGTKVTIDICYWF